MQSRKIVFVIVEGPSDEDALGVLFNRIYDKETVYVEVMHCDITTEKHVTPSNIVAKVGDVVKHYAGRHFRPNDFTRIIHIADTDGAFVPADAVIYDPEKQKPLYTETAIYTRNKSGIEARNQCKSENLRRLSSTSTIWNIPYQIYYMSCNLDHVLYGKQNSSDTDKQHDSMEFAERYENDIPSFLRFISDSEFSVKGEYRQSWQYIQDGLHSLARYTNLGVCFCYKQNK